MNVEAKRVMAEYIAADRGVRVPSAIDRCMAEGLLWALDGEGFKVVAK